MSGCVDHRLVPVLVRRLHSLLPAGRLFASKIMGVRAKKREKALRRLEKRAQLEAEVKAGTRPEPNMRQAKGWDEIVKENQNFETYYKAQGIVPEQDWDKFMTTLRSPLAASFRITSYFCGQAAALRKMMESDEFRGLFSVSADTQKEVLACLKWYPNRLAYQLNCSRLDIKKSAELQRLHNFMLSETEAGYISRQEAVSMIPPLVLDIKPNQKILDMCAAPGSKTAQIIESLHDSEGCTDGVVVANDVDNKRCYMLVHQAKRLHSPSCVITNHDASIMPTFYEQDEKGERQEMKFDRILCDVPCSGDGTLRKNADIWKTWNAANGNNFHGLQYKIAKRGLELLKNGGLMAYSTCSLNPQEDESVIASLLRDGGVELVDVADRLPELKYIPGLTDWKVFTRESEIIKRLADVPEKNATQIRESMFPPANAEDLHLERCIRVLPHLQDTGGFFVAVLRKTVDKLPWELEKIAAPEPLGETEANGDEPAAKKKKEKYKRQKREHTKGFKELPFMFLDREASLWPEMKNFYKIKDGFPIEQLMFRSAEGKKRNLYFMTKSARQLVLDNQEKIKFINAGARLFARNTEKDFACSYRLTQEGLPSIFSFIDKTHMIKLTFDDMKNILIHDNYPVESLSEEVKKRVEPLLIGSCILLFEAESQTGGEKLVVPMCGWRGKGTLRPYIAKNERIHFLRICGVDPKLLEEENRQQFLDKMGRKAVRVAKELEKRKEAAAIMDPPAGSSGLSATPAQVEEKAEDLE